MTLNAKIEGRCYGAEVVSAQRASGRPQVTSHAAIEAAAFELFATRGFEATTMDDIAAVLGVSRRTLFRYYPSKSDIPWGLFDASLVRLKASLWAVPAEIPVFEAVQRAVLDFNRLDEGAVAQHRRRMALLLGTPALQAHSVIRHAQWCRVIAEYVAARYALSPEHMLPRVVGRVCLALAMTAYEQWLEQDDGGGVEELLERSMADLRHYLVDDGRPS
jgi:mycofactocin system transcriptional regulator